MPDYREGGGVTLPVMLEISSHERRALRAQAHHLHPVVTIGQQGITPTVLTEIDLALNAHGLIKVRVFIDDRHERETMLAEIAEGLEAAAVQHIGKLFVLWRPQPEAAPEAGPARAARAKRGKAPAKTAREQARDTPKGIEPVGRRARGEHRAGQTGQAGRGEEQRRGPSTSRSRRDSRSGSPPAASRRATTGSDRDQVGKPSAKPPRDAARGPSAPNPRRRRGPR